MRGRHPHNFARAGGRAVAAALAKRLWMIDEREYAQLGAGRFTVTWYTILPRAKDTPRDELDWDRDIEANVDAFATMVDALEHAKKVGPDSFFGMASIQQQVAIALEDSPEPNIGEWSDIGESEEIS